MMMMMMMIECEMQIVAFHLDYMERLCYTK